MTVLAFNELIQIYFANLTIEQSFNYFTLRKYKKNIRTLVSVKVTKIYILKDIKRIFQFFDKNSSINDTYETRTRRSRIRIKTRIDFNFELDLVT